MKRPITNLVIGLLALFASHLAAQPTFSVSPQTITANAGDNITVDIVVSSFDNILTFQYSMNWNPAVLEFQSPVGNISPSQLPGMNASSFGTTGTGNGILTVSWSDQNATGVTVADGTILYSLTFHVLSSQPATINFGNAPTAMEVYNGAGMDITAGTTFIGASVNGGSGGGGGGGGGNPVSGFAVIASDETAAPGDQVCVDVTVNDFTNILSMQYTMEFDESKWQFVNIPTNNFGLPGLTIGNFGTNLSAQGQLTLSWSDPNATGVTVANGTVIYQVCLNAIGADNCNATTPFQFNSAVTPIEVYNGNSQPVTFQSDPGDLEICSSGGGGGGGNGDLTFIAGEVESPAGSQICVDFTVENFNCIVSAQYTVHFDQTVIQFASVQGFGLPDLTSANFGTTETNNGILRFSWPSPDPVNGNTVADGTVIFQVCFNVVGANGTVGNITFNGDPMPIEVSSCNSQNVTPVFDPGSVTVGVTCTGPLSITNSSITPVSCAGGSDGGVPITVTGGSATKTYVWKNASGTTVGTSQNLTGVPAGLYTVTVTSCGGNETATAGPFQVTQPLALHVDNTTQNIACFGETNGSIDITVTGGTNTGTGCTGYTYTWSNGATSQDITGLSAGSYTVTVTDCKGCTIVSGPFTISAPPSALTATVSSTNILCNGAANGTITVTASGGGNTKEYRINNGNWGTNNVFNNLAAGTYTVDTRDQPYGCVKTNTVTITEPTAINITLTPNPPSGGQANGSITSNITGGIGSYSCNWSGPNGAIQGCNPTNLGPGNYCVTVTDGNGCTKVKCTLLSAPVTDNGSTFKNACAGTCNGEIHVVASGGITPYTYTWSDNGTGSDRTGLCAGTYTVTVSNPSLPQNQFLVQTFTITQPTQGVSAILANFELPTTSASCNGSITLSPQGGSGSGYTYVWSGTSQTTNPIFNLCEGTYAATITDGNGCTGTYGPYILDYIPVPLDSPQVSAINACASQNNGQVTLSISGGTPPYKYQISGPPSAQMFTTSQTSYTFSNLAGGAHTFTITDSGQGVDQQSKNGSVTIDVTTLAVTPVVVTHATGLAPQSGHVDITPSGGQAPYTYQWNNGASSQDLFSVAHGCYELTMQDANGCVQVFNNIGVGELTASFSDVKPDCPQQLGSITATALLNESCAVANTPYTYKWSDANGTVSMSQTADNLPPGNYTVTITDSKGTSIVQQHTLESESNLSVSANITTDYNGYDIRCYGGSGGAAIAVPMNGVTPYTYAWSNGKTTQAVSGLGADITYLVTVTDGHGCQMSTSLQLEGPTQLSAEGNASASGCTEGDTGQASVTVSGGVPAYSYSWSNGDKDRIADNLTPGNNYSVTVTDFNGCTMIENVTVPLIETLKLTAFSVSDSGGPSGVAGVIVTGGTPPYKYVWKDYPTVADSILTELFPGNYIVVVTDGNGCQATKPVKVDDDTECGEVRTVITPEGDGKNEEFLIKCLNRFSDNTLEIYNRWGQQVYRTENYNDDNLWRGTNSLGNDVPDGVYFYVFNYFDPGINAYVTKKGSVTVLRK
ncbi:MAG: hypothetical protein GC192_07785 [Bacteroidetes bacterium]|nr:hypothetical protein [Bacteroidota bacterium]